jgi:anti-anti-sigma regulatory factor
MSEDKTMSDRPLVQIQTTEDKATIVAVLLPVELTGEVARKARDEARQAFASLDETMFSLLIDLRSVDQVEESALARLRELEGAAGRTGRLARLCHLVKTQAQIQATTERLAKAGHSGLFRDFTDEAAALRYLLERPVAATA